MAKGESKGKESKAVTVRKPADIITRRDDFGQLFDRFDRFFEDFWRRPFPSLFGREAWWPTEISTRLPSLDVYEEKDDVVVKAEMPGMKKEDIEVNILGDLLTIKGEKKKEEEVKEQDYYRRERSYGSFARSVSLPCEVKSDQVKASFKDGVLEVRMPKTEEAKKKSITVKVE